MDDRGELPSVVHLLDQSIRAALGEPLPILLASLGMMIVMTLLVTVPVVVTVCGFFFFAVVAAEGSGSETSNLLWLGLSGVMIPVMYAVVASLAAFSASLIRALWAWQEGGVAPSFNAAVSTIFQGPLRAISVASLTFLIALAGLSMCVLPGIALGIAMQFALVGVAVDSVSPLAAIRRSVEHARDHPGWHLQIWVFGVLLVFVLGNVPFIGSALGMVLCYDFLCRAYRAGVRET
jgi:hypothetical protein